MQTTEYLSPQSIGYLPGSYVGGFSQWYYTYKEFLSGFPSINPSTQFLNSEPALISGKTWYGPVNIAKTLIGFSETTASAKAGPYWKYQVQAILPGGNSNIDVNLDNMMHHEIVLVGKLRSGGFWKIIGNNKKGLTVDINTDTGKGSRAILLNTLTLTGESIYKAPVLPSFSGDDSTPPFQTIVTVIQPDMEEIPFNTSGDTVIDWTINRRVTRFGNYPVIEVWVLNDSGTYSKSSIPIDSVGTPPTQFIVRNEGGNGVIKIM